MASDERQKATRDGAAKRAPQKPSSSENGPVGDALRTVYERTVSESIPQEMLDLLGKLD